MFSEFLHRLAGTARRDGARLAEPDARIALAALLVRVAKSDHSYQAREISLIDRLLARRFALNPVEAAKLRAQAEKLEHQAPPAETFAGLIREAVSYGERIEVLEALWQVVMVDGLKLPAEAEVIARAAAALGLSAQDTAEVAARNAP